MKLLFAFAVLFCLPFVAVGQPIVNPDMVEISFDGTTFQDASAYVSGIVISVGVASTVHIKHARRGSIVKWEAQLGEPWTDRMVEWKVDTGLISGNKFYMRFSVGVDENGTLIGSIPSVVSDDVTLIGRPSKPVNRGLR